MIHPPSADAQTYVADPARPSLRVEVTAVDIAAHPDLDVHDAWAAPVQTALARLTGQEVDIDAGDALLGRCVATIGQDDWTITIDLPDAANDWLNVRWHESVPGEPIAFDLEVPDWIVAIVARATSVEQQGAAVLRQDGLA